MCCCTCSYNYNQISQAAVPSNNTNKDLARKQTKIVIFCCYFEDFSFKIVLLWRYKIPNTEINF